MQLKFSIAVRFMNAKLQHPFGNTNRNANNITSKFLAQFTFSIQIAVSYRMRIAEIKHLKQIYRRLRINDYLITHSVFTF